MAALLAGQGYLVAAPEVYHEFEKPGTVLAYDVPGTDRGNDLKFTKEVSAFDSDTRAGLDFMAQHECCTGRLGVMGICRGGHADHRYSDQDQFRRRSTYCDVLKAIYEDVYEYMSKYLPSQEIDETLAAAESM